MTRKTISLDKETYDRLAELKQDNESWTEFGDRVAGEIDGRDGEHEVNTLTEDHIDDIAGETARRVVQDLETALR